MPLGPARGEKAPISKTRRIELDGIKFRLTAEELEKGIATLPFLPKSFKTTAKRGAPKFRITDATLDRVFEAMNSTANDLPLLFMHGKDPHFGGIAAGWILEKLREPDRIAVKVKLNERTLEHLRKGELGYLSPGLDVEEHSDGTVEPYDGFELSFTNTPLIDGQQRIAADRDGGIMDTKKLAKLAGVAEDSSEDAILEALGKKLTTPPPPAGGDIPEAQMKVLADRVMGQLTETLVKTAGATAEKLIESDRKKVRVEMLLERAMKNGKAVAADRKATVAGKEVDPMRIFCEAHPDAFEQWEKNAVRKAPVAGAFPKGDGQDAVTRTEAGSFADADLTNPEVRMELHRAAQTLVAGKKATDYEAATLTLTRAQ